MDNSKTGNTSGQRRGSDPCCTAVPADWLVRGELQKMVLVITSSETREVLERWTFDLQTDKSIVEGG